MEPSTDLPLAGEWIWVTGASSGIGRALSLQLARAGARVIASARRLELLESLAEQHTNIRAIAFDVTNEAAIAATREHILSLTPFLNRVVLNAGTCEYFCLDDPDWGMMRRVMAVNYFGAVNSLEVALPLLRCCPQRGHVIGIASLATAAPFHRAEAYGASKAALQYWLDSLRADSSQANFDVTVICPGFVETPLTDSNDFEMPFMIPVQEAAQRILAAIIARRRSFAFPARLSWLLKILTCVPGVWYRWVLPRLQN